MHWPTFGSLNQWCARAHFRSPPVASSLLQSPPILFLPYSNTNFSATVETYFWASDRLQLACSNWHSTVSSNIYFNKAFSKAGNLKTHLLMHSGIKINTCLDCNKTFSLSVHLKRHLMTHSGIKMYTCADCDKTFSQAGNLKKAPPHSQWGETAHMCTMRQIIQSSWRVEETPFGP